MVTMSPEALVPPHADDLPTALDHYNSSFRLRYRLPPATLRALEEAEGLGEETDRFAEIRASGVLDASCALIARAVVSAVPRYAVGLVDGGGVVHAHSPDAGEDEAYWGNYALLINPLGFIDNWEAIAEWVRQVGGEDARRGRLAGLASEKRPDRKANLLLLRKAASEHGRAVVLPPDEGFNKERAAEVGYIYGYEVETLRTWKRKYRAPLSGHKAGKPARNR